MTAQPLLRPAVTGEGEVVPDVDFDADLRALGSRYEDLWHATDAAEPIPGGRQAERLVAFVADEIEDLPDEEERTGWRVRVEYEIRLFGAERLAWPEGYGSLLLGNEFYDSTVEFVREARKFDPELEAGDIGQALRNVWIVNSLQMLLDLPVVMTPAVFAYSLLYPYTDNFLDDDRVTESAKRSLIQGLGRRLGGDRIEAVDRHQHRIFELIGKIEGQFGRAQAPEVFASLRGIHQAQTRSLEQQGGAETLSDEDVLAISVAKGGVSVLADGYLAATTLRPEEADFCFGYGVLLQLLDDLQDVRSDHEVGHETVFSCRLGSEPLDSAASRLYQFMHHVVEDSSRFGEPEFADRKDLIVRNCSFLLVGAVAENHDLFSPGFVRRLERRWPLRFRAMRKLCRRSKRRFSEASRRLCDKRGVGSFVELL
jgi:hypothetical protein